MDTLESLTIGKPVVIICKSSCCMSHTLKNLICRFGANPTVYELDKLSDGQQLEKALAAASRHRPILPVLFIGQELVGGANEVMSFHVQGKLVPLLKKAKAI